MSFLHRRSAASAVELYLRIRGSNLQEQFEKAENMPAVRRRFGAELVRGLVRRRQAVCPIKSRVPQRFIQDPTFMLSQRPPPFEPAPSTAQEEAYQHIRHAIRMGVMRPNVRLVPEEIATSIGMSRMPVREAMNRLAAEGLIVMRPNRGAVVRGLTEKEVREVFEMRAVLEGLAASMAVSRVVATDIQDLEQLLVRMKHSASSTSEWITVHRQFHERLCAISDAPRLMYQISALHSVVEPLMRIWLENWTSPSYVQDVHEDLLVALRAGDAAAMETKMRAHVLRTIAGITTAMQHSAELAKAG